MDFLTFKTLEEAQQALAAIDEAFGFPNEELKTYTWSAIEVIEHLGQTLYTIAKPEERFVSQVNADGVLDESLYMDSDKGFLLSITEDQFRECCDTKMEAEPT